LETELGASTTQSAARINELTASLKSASDEKVDLGNARDALASRLEENQTSLQSAKEASEASVSTFQHQISAMKFELSRTKIALKESEAENVATSQDQASNVEELSVIVENYESDNTKLKTDLAVNVEKLEALLTVHSSTEKSVSILSESLERVRKDHADALVSLKESEAQLQTMTEALDAAEQLAQELQNDLIAKTMQKAQMWNHTDALETAVRKSATTWTNDDDAHECSRWEAEH